MTDREALIRGYADHMKSLGYPPHEVTLLIIGFAAGLDAQHD